MSSTDTAFTLPGTDDPALTEAGVILMGLDAERLLAGLAAAALADDPGRIALTVDYARHGAAHAVAFDDLVDEGAQLWLEVCPQLPPPSGPQSGSLRGAWDDALRAVAAATAEAGPSRKAYVAACWLRRDDITRCARTREPEGGR